MFCFKVKIIYIIYLNLMLYGTILSKILEHPSSYCNSSRESYALRFRLPFTDLEITSQQSVIVLKESQNHAIFILHGIELYHLLISPNDTKLSMIGKLMARENVLQHSVHADVISWRSTVIFVVAREKYLEVYQISQTAIAEDEMNNNILNENREFLPIQEIAIEGYFKEMRLFALKRQRIVLMVTANIIQHHGSLKTYEWVDTYFNILEIITLPPIHSLNVVNSHTNNIIVGTLNEDQSKMTLRIFEMGTSTMQMKSIQILMVATGITHSWIFEENNYMALCPTDSILSKCTFFKMIDNRFKVIQNHIKSDGIINKLIAGEHFIVSEQGSEVVVYTDINFDCFAAFKTNLTNATSIMMIPENANSQFILLNYIQQKSALLRIVKIEYDIVLMPRSMDFEDSTINPHWNVFEDVLMQLRSILLKRKTIIEYFRDASNMLSPKLVKFKTKSPVRINAGNINIIQIIGKTLRSPIEMLQAIWRISRDYRMLQQSKESGPLYNGRLKMIAEECFVQNLIYNGSVVDGFSITTKAHSIPMLTVEPFLTTERLETLELLTEQLPQNSPIYRTRDRIGSTYKTRKLVVNRINGMVWKEFYESLFLRNRNSQITGQIIFQKPVRVGDLKTKKLNHIETRNFFNLNKPQTVRSSIKVLRFFVSSMQVDEMNGLNITKDIARRGVNNFIRSPVDIYEVSVIGDLLLSEDDDFVKRHVIGTSSVDLQQTYTGQVILNGSLTINDLFIEDPNSTMLIIDGYQFSEKTIQANYMRKNESQIFPYPVTVANAKITAPKLETIFLNEHLYSEHLLTTGKNVENANLLLILMSVNISGNIHLDKEFPSQLRQLKTDIVRRNENAVITGIKYFAQPLTLEALNVTMFNEILVNDFVFKSDKIVNFLDRKIFSQIVVRSEFLVEQQLTVDTMNNVSLNIERHYDSVKLTERLNASNVIFGNINGMLFDNIFASVEVSKNGELVLHKDLYVEGSVHFVGDLKVDRVNGINLNSYLTSLVRLNENIVITGKKTFANSLQITNNLRTSTINRIDINEMLSNIFLKSQPQIITGTYTFDSLLLTDAIVPIINDINTNLFIDIRSSNVTINSDVIVQKFKILGNIYGQFNNNNIDLTALTQTMRNITKTSWREIIVLGNAQWNQNEEMDTLEHLNAHAVRRFGEQVITGNVKLNKPIIKSMTTTSQEIFDGYNIEFIASDCLFRNHSKLQIITVGKTFDGHLKLAEVEANGLVGAKFINGIDVVKYNSTIYRRNDSSDLFTPLKFHMPLKVGILSVNGTLNGITENQIYHNFDQPIPSLQIDKLFIEDVLLLKNVNNISLDELMRYRIPKVSENVVNVSGFLSFENLILDKNTNLKSINDIEIDKIVLKTSQDLQIISAPKIVKGNLTLTGPVQIDLLNRKNVRDKYQKTIFLNKNYIFDELSIDSAIFRGGLLIPESENFAKSITELKNIEQQLSYLANNLSENNSYRFVYFDYDYSPAVEWNLINDTTTGREELIFNLDSEFLCNQQFVKLSTNYNQIHLNREISNTMTVTKNGLQVVAKNYCSKFYSFANSEIAIHTAATNLFKVFQLKNHIRTVDLLIVDTDAFILLHTIDLFSNRNDIRILKIDSMSLDIVDWQTLSQDIGDVTRIYKFANYTTIVSAAIIGNQPAVTVYAYSCIFKRFIRQQVFNGNFNIIEMIRIDHNKYHLYLSCNGCQHIVIYQFDTSESNMFQPNSYFTFQIVEEKMEIATLNVFIVNEGDEDDVYLFAIPKQQNYDFYHIYRYTAIHGYVHFTIGYFPVDTQLILPLLGAGGINRIDGMPILLLCNSDEKCSLLKVYFQF